MPANEEKNVLDVLGEEMTLRINFEKYLQDKVEELFNRPIPPNIGHVELVSRFFKGAPKQLPWIWAAATATLDHDSSPNVTEVVVPTNGKANWSRVIKKLGSKRTTEWIRSLRTSSFALDKTWVAGFPFPGSPELIVSSCFGSSTPLSLFVIADDSTAAYRHLLQTAAYWLGSLLSMTQRMRAQAEAANMIAHISSSSVEMADFRLQSAEKHLAALAVSMEESQRAEAFQRVRNELDAARNELKDAQRALQRGLIWSSEAPRFKKEINLWEELTGVVQSLNDSTRESSLGEIVDSAAVKQCGELLKQWCVNGSSSRLRQSLRDVTLGAWMLSKRTKLEVTCKIDPQNRTTAITFRGQDSNIPDDWSAEELQERFLDPEVFCLTSQKGIVERALTFDWTQRLLSQIKAQLRPAVTGKKFELSIDFNECSIGRTL